MAKFCVSLMSRRPNVPSKNWSHIIQNVHFMHLSQSTGFIYKLGNKLGNNSAEKNLKLWSIDFARPAKVTKELKTG